MLQVGVQALRRPRAVSRARQPVSRMVAERGFLLSGGICNGCRRVYTNWWNELLHPRLQHILFYVSKKKQKEKKGQGEKETKDLDTLSVMFSLAATSTLGTLLQRGASCQLCMGSGCYPFIDSNFGKFHCVQLIGASLGGQTCRLGTQTPATIKIRQSHCDVLMALVLTCLPQLDCMIHQILYVLRPWKSISHLPGCPSACGKWFSSVRNRLRYSGPQLTALPPWRSPTTPQTILQSLARLGV